MSAITPGEALEILTVITACHHRTAPRWGDDEAALAIATTWADLLSGYGISTAEYVTAVKSRAKGCPEAPEPADLIRVARATRQNDMSHKPDYHRQGGETPYYPGDEIAAADPPEYPREWTTAQRLTAYWYAIRLKAMPTTTRGWLAILDQAEAEHEKRAADRDGVPQ